MCGIASRLRIDCSDEPFGLIVRRGIDVPQQIFDRGWSWMHYAVTTALSSFLHLICSCEIVDLRSKGLAICGTPSIQRRPFDAIYNPHLDRTLSRLQF